MSFDGIVPDYGIYAKGKSHELVQFKAADYKVKHLFQLVFTELMETLTPPELEVYKYVSKVSDQYIKWTETRPLKSKCDAFSTFQSLRNTKVVMSSGFHIEHLLEGQQNRRVHQQ